jgi:hypothetical protein
MKTKTIRAKAIAGFPLLTKLDFTKYGEAANNPKFQSALCLHHAADSFLFLERNRARLPRHSLKHIPQHQKIAWETFLRHFAESSQTGDGSLWRSLADIIEVTKSNPKGVMPGWGYVGAQIGAADAFKMPRPTKKKLREDLAQILGRKVDPTEIKRYLQYMELPTKGKPGRPRKSKNQDR